jgi:hypothetical protein
MKSSSDANSMDPIVAVIKRSNQRGGRMLSIIDLLDAGTLTRRQLCWLLARLEKGSSWLVGARPGGAGKTTVMSALLGMLPAGETVRLANPGAGWENSRPEDCIVAYEIGRGSYDAYIWGRDLVRMTELGQAGCRIVTNLHADTLGQAREQIAHQCGAEEKGLCAFKLFIPISISGGPWSPHRIVPTLQFCEQGCWRNYEEQETAPTLRETAIGAFLDDCLANDLRTVGSVRKAWLVWRESNP